MVEGSIHLNQVIEKTLDQSEAFVAFKVGDPKQLLLVSCLSKAYITNGIEA
jgi:hypothetical protein